MRVVIDTNVLISALITAGKPLLLLDKAVDKKIQMLTSKDILTEFVRVASDERIRKYTDENHIIDLLEVIDGTAELIKVKSKFKIVKTDPTDDLILRAAFDGKADFIVSGDKHLLSIGEFRGIRILTVNQILALLGAPYQ